MRLIAALVLSFSAYAQVTINSGFAHPTVSPANPNVIYTDLIAATVDGSDLGSPVVTRDGGATWTAMYLRPQGSQQPDILSIRALDAQNILMSTNMADGGVWASRDGGATWQISNQGMTASTQNVYLLNTTSEPNRVYATVGTLLYKSIDAGRTWAVQGTLPRAPVDNNDVHVVPSNPRIMFAAAGSGISRSTDEGATWSGVYGLSGFTNDTFRAVYTLPGNPSVVLAGSEGSAVNIHFLVRSTDGGTTWTRTQGGFFHSFVADPRGTVYAQSSPTGFCRSIDNGANWSCGGSFTDPLQLRSVGIFPDPLRGETRLIFSAGSILRTTDGVNFTTITPTMRPNLMRPNLPAAVRIRKGDIARVEFSINCVEFNCSMPYSATITPSWATFSAPPAQTPVAQALVLDTTSVEPGAYTVQVRIDAPQSQGGYDFYLPVIVEPRASSNPPYQVSRVETPVPDAGNLVIDASGNLFVIEGSGARVRRIASNGTTTVVAGTDATGDTGDNGPATSARISAVSLAVASSGDLYIYQVNKIRRVREGVITTISQGGTAQTNFLSYNGRGIAVDPSGDLLFTVNTGIARRSADGSVTVILSAGAPPSFEAHDLVIDPNGGIYFADRTHHVIWKTRPSLQVAAGILDRSGFNGDNLPGPQTLLDSPQGLSIDSAGHVYFIDSGNARIRVLNPDGFVRTIAGTGSSNSPTVGMPSGETRVYALSRSTAVDRNGNVYFSDLLADRVFRLDLQRTVPAVAAGGFLSAAFASATLSPGSLFSIYGTNLSRSTVIAGSAPWPTTLGEATVTINGVRAPLFYVSPTQINGQVPYEIGPGAATAVVSSGGVSGTAVTAQVRPAAPGILAFGANRAVVVNQNGAINVPEAPAQVGSAVTVYLIGIGALDNAVPTGAAAPIEPLSRARLPFRAMIGDREAMVLFLGLTPGYIGLVQANIVIPALPPGDYPLTIIVDGVESNKPLITISE